MSVLVITDGNDPTALALADASVRLGHRVSVVDLRLDRFELRIGPEPLVAVNGDEVASGLVVNRTGVNGLGQAPPEALRRQRGRTWYEVHSAAREEQGLLLGVFDALAMRGHTVVNPPAAAEMEQMRHLVIERLARAGLPVGVREDAADRYIVVGGRIALAPGQDHPDRSVLHIAATVAEEARFDLGWIECSTTGPRLVDWGAQIDLDLFERPVADGMALSIMTELAGKAETHETRAELRPLITDMIDRYDG